MATLLAYLFINDPKSKEIATLALKVIFRAHQKHFLVMNLSDLAKFRQNCAKILDTTILTRSAVNLIKEKYRTCAITLDPINQTLIHEASGVNPVFTQKEEHKFADLAKPVRLGHELFLDELSKPSEWKKTAQARELPLSEWASESDSPRRRRVIKKKTERKRSGPLGVLGIEPRNDNLRVHPIPPQSLATVQNSPHCVFVALNGGTREPGLAFAEGLYTLTLTRYPVEGETWKLSK